VQLRGPTEDSLEGCLIQRITSTVKDFVQLLLSTPLCKVLICNAYVLKFPWNYEVACFWVVTEVDCVRDCSFVCMKRVLQEVSADCWNAKATFCVEVSATWLCTPTKVCIWLLLRGRIPAT
jgi:hypothetical protein